MRPNTWAWLLVVASWCAIVLAGGCTSIDTMGCADGLTRRGDVCVGFGNGFTWRVEPPRPLRPMGAI